MLQFVNIRKFGGDISGSNIMSVYWENKNRIQCFIHLNVKLNFIVVLKFSTQCND